MKLLILPNKEKPKMEWHCPELGGEWPAARNLHAAAVLNERMYMWGGRGTDACLADLHIYDTSYV